MSVIISCLSGYCTLVRERLLAAFTYCYWSLYLFPCSLNVSVCVNMDWIWATDIFLYFSFHFCVRFSQFSLLPPPSPLLLLLLFIIPVYRIRFVPHVLHFLWKFSTHIYTHTHTKLFVTLHDLMALVRSCFCFWYHFARRIELEAFIMRTKLACSP